MRMIRKPTNWLAEITFELERIATALERLAYGQQFCDDRAKVDS